MTDSKQNLSVLFIGTQATLLAIFLLLLTQSIPTLTRTAEIYIGLSILLAAGGTAIVAREVNR
jgi:hypothetical protein